MKLMISDSLFKVTMFTLIFFFDNFKQKRNGSFTCRFISFCSVQTLRSFDSSFFAVVVVYEARVCEYVVAI